MKKRKIKISRLIIVVLSGIILATGLIYAFTSTMPIRSQGEPSASPTSVSVSYVHKDWDENKRINADYIGDIEFESGLVIEKVVQATDNEKYLDLSWDLSENSNGAVFLDYRNKADDQNTILYGHYVYKDESLVFGPLHDLIKKENYNENMYIQFNLQNERRIYEVTNVFYYEMDNPTLEYFHTNYDENYFDLYYENVKNHSFYDTQKEITYEDQFLTLQTCVRNRDDLRLIVIAKRIRE